MDAGNVNKIIPELLTLSTQHNKEILNRFTICDILSSFESRNSKEFQKFVTESNNRYKGVKSGNQIKSIVVRSKEKIKPISQRILNDKFYTELSLDKEKKQLSHKLNTKQNKNIRKLIKNIKESTNTYSKSERKFRDKLNNKLEQKKKSHKATSKNYNSKDMSTLTEDSKLSSLSPLSFDKKSRNVDTIHEFFEKEDTLLNEEIEHHKKILNEIKNCIDEEDNENKFNNTNDIEDGYYNPKVKKIKYKINFNPNIIKLLNYQKPVQAPVGKNKVNIYSDPVDIKKLRKYSKSNNSMKLNNSKYHHFISLSTETRREKEENVRNLKKNIVNNVDYTDTKNLVRDEAITSASMNEAIQEKQKRIESKFSKFTLPLISEYDNIVKEKTLQNKLKREQYVINNCATLSNEDAKKRRTLNNLEKIFEKWNFSKAIIKELENGTII